MDSSQQNLGNSIPLKFDVKDLETEYLIEADLPGVKKEDVTVDYRDNKLVIRVSSNEEVNEEKEHYIQ